MKQLMFTTAMMAGCAGVLGAASPVMGQFLYPPVSDDQGIMVVGQGVASLPAETAEIDFFLVNYDPYAAPTFPEGLPPDSGEATSIPEPQPITRQALQPIVDVLVEAGIPNTEIEVNLDSTNPGGYSYEPGATISLTIDQPSQPQVRQLVDAVTAAVADEENIFLQNTSVRYGVEDCQALETAVYEAAVTNARSRAEAIANAMDIELRNVPSVAESPFNLLTNACDSSSAFSLPFGAGYGTSYYDPEAPAEVQLRRDVFVTFPVR